MVIPRFSIIIPNFNKASYLENSINSVLLQTFKNWECIIIDDHSTDSSWEIIEGYANKDHRIKPFKRPRNRKKGGNAARNYGIQLAKGEFVALLDSDDIWGPNRLELALQFLTSNNIEALFSGAIVVSKNYTQKLSSRNIRDGESIFDFILSDDVFCPTPSFILRRELAQEILFDEDLKRHQDYDFFIRAHMKKAWSYFENFDVKVNWVRDDLKVINYRDCIPFYEKHWEKSKNEQIRHKYIVRITSSSIRESFNNNVAKYYRNILKNEGYRFSFQEYIMFFFPYIFFVLSKFKWFTLGAFNKLGISQNLKN
ncbi:glycosyltransferase family 2 protein [Algoriphagus formosus]|uniref:glycosyltransferase family 2 protein n=1 Tax=Algoriphagus formosus TaxID=2007308 RepID=UPI000C291B47|nr:glycosyltransferase family 2 protein [Algoriphagus formosus]